MKNNLLPGLSFNFKKTTQAAGLGFFLWATLSVGWADDPAQPAATTPAEPPAAAAPSTPIPAAAPQTPATATVAEPVVQTPTTASPAPIQPPQTPATVVPENPPTATPAPEANASVPPPAPPLLNSKTGLPSCVSNLQALVDLYTKKTQEIKKLLEKSHGRLRSLLEQEASIQNDINDVKKEIASEPADTKKGKQEIARYEKQIIRLKKQLKEAKKNTQKLCQEVAEEISEIASEHLQEIKQVFKDTKNKVQYGDKADEDEE